MLGNSNNRNKQAFIFSLLANFSFATGMPIINYIIDQGYTAFQVISFNALGGIIFIVLYCIRQRKGILNHIRFAEPRLMCARVLIDCGAAITIFSAFYYLPIATTVTLTFVSPLLITIGGAIFFKEKLTGVKIVAVIVGFIAVAIIIRPGFVAFNMGYALLVFANFFLAGSWLMAKKLAVKHSSISMALALTAGAAVFTGLISVPFYRSMSLVIIVVTVASGAFGAIGHLLNIRAYSLGDVTIISPVIYTQVIWTTLYGFFFFSEAIDPFVFIGSALLMLSTVAPLVIERYRKV